MSTSPNKHAETHVHALEDAGAVKVAGEEVGAPDVAFPVAVEELGPHVGDEGARVGA